MEFDEKEEKSDRKDNRDRFFLPVAPGESCNLFQRLWLLRHNNKTNNRKEELMLALSN